MYVSIFLTISDRKIAKLLRPPVYLIVPKESLFGIGYHIYNITHKTDRKSVFTILVFFEKELLTRL